MDREMMIHSLINISLGLSQDRYHKIKNREALKWMIPTFISYEALKEVSFTADVGDEFRKQKKSDIPMLMVHGNLDTDTPYENATYLQPFFKDSHLVTLNNVGHNGELRLLKEYPEALNNILSFFEADFNKTPFKEFKKSIKDSYDLKELEFVAIDGSSLYDILTKR